MLFILIELSEMVLNVYFQAKFVKLLLFQVVGQKTIFFFSKTCYFICSTTVASNSILFGMHSKPLSLLNFLYSRLFKTMPPKVNGYVDAW